MPGENPPKLYLVTPAHPAMAGFPDQLAHLLDSFEVACVRMGQIAGTETEITRIADTLRPICHARDVPLLITDHFRLTGALGLDGVHLTDGSRKVRSARRDMPHASILGSYAHTSRHEGITAGETGADYVSFGPLTPSSLGDGDLAPRELFEWWAQMIEVPLVAEGGLTIDVARDLAGLVEFIALGDEIWSAPDGPEPALRDYAAALA